MNKGIILRGIGGFYTVLPVGDDIETVECKARGRFRKEKMAPLPGDTVVFQKLPDGSGWLEEICPRKNMFVRPPVSNIDLLVMVVSENPPKSSPFLIDRMTIMAARNNIQMILAINKSDIGGEGLLKGIYSAAGFPVFCVSAKTRQGVDSLLEALSGKTAAFAGHSGVGKSSLLNAMDFSSHRKTGEISERLGRGRHTTRHVELFKMSNGALIADTPGFSALETVGDIPKERLSECFIDITKYEGRCKYSGCLHVGVSGCAVEEAVNKGEIQSSRYQSYVRLLTMK